jgi:hypothetical protein
VEGEVGASSAVGSDGDVIVAIGFVLVHLVQERVHETERGFSGGQTVRVQQGDDTTPDGAGSGGSSDLDGTSVLDDEDSSSDGSNIGVTSVGAVPVLLAGRSLSPLR